MGLSNSMKVGCPSWRKAVGRSRMVWFVICFIGIGACSRTAIPDELFELSDTSISKGEPSDAKKIGKVFTAQGNIAQRIEGERKQGQKLLDITKAKTEKATSEKVRLDKDTAIPVDADATTLGSKAGDYKVDKKISIRYRKPKVQGDLSAIEIGRTVKAHHDDLIACGGKIPKNGSFGMGKVEIKFIISGTGAVQMATTYSSKIKMPEIENCLKQTVRGWTFPKPKGGGIVIVTLPLLVTPN